MKFASLLLLLLVSTAAAAEPVGLEEATKHYDKQQYQACLKIVKSSIDREHPRVRMLEGNCEYALGNIKRALELYESISAATDAHIEPILGQAKCHYILNSFTKSLQNYELVLKRDPKSIVAARGKGACLAYLGKDQEALQEYNRTKDEPFTADEVDLWLHLLTKAERWDEAVRYCERNVLPETDSLIRPRHKSLPADLEHGKEQYAQLTKDRPELLRDAKLAKLLEKWCVEAFAGRLTGRRVYWTADRTRIPRGACSAVYVDPHDRLSLAAHEARTVRTILTKENNQPTDHDVIEFLWCMVVFEQFNAQNVPRFAEVGELAAGRKIGKEEFCLRLAQIEHISFQRAREFYVRTVWPGLHGKATNPRFWFIDHPQDFSAWHAQHKDAENPWQVYRSIFDGLK